jgi:hypothetical protein
MSHTPGPWKVADRFHVWTADKVGCEVAAVCVENLDDDGLGQADADARLIAAAPDLLAACKLALTAGDQQYVQFILRAAIAKAEGVTTEETNGKERSLD